MPTTLKGTELRHRAITLIDEHGWVQGWTGNPDSGFSPVGALQRAACTGIVHWDCYLDTVADLAHTICGREGLPRDMSEWTIDTWNSQKGRTFDDIRGLLAG